MKEWSIYNIFHTYNFSLIFICILNTIYFLIYDFLFSSRIKTAKFKNIRDTSSISEKIDLKFFRKCLQHKSILSELQKEKSPHKASRSCITLPFPLHTNRKPTNPQSTVSFRASAMQTRVSNKSSSLNLPKEDPGEASLSRDQPDPNSEEQMNTQSSLTEVHQLLSIRQVFSLKRPPGRKRGERGKGQRGLL